MFTDIELIEKVKNESDSDAVCELVNRHSGAYLQVANKYCNMSSGKLSYQDLQDDKMHNIYKYALSYNPDKQTKFSTYVMNMTRYTCLDALKEQPQIKLSIDVETQYEKDGGGEFVNVIDKELADTNIIPVEISFYTEEIMQAIDKVVKNKKFKKIVQLRHPSGIAKGLNWVKIGKEVGLSNEGARKIYNSGIKKVKRYLKK